MSTIKLSKAQWEFIGQKAGWMKKKAAGGLGWNADGWHNDHKITKQLSNEEAEQMNSKAREICASRGKPGFVNETSQKIDTSKGFGFWASTIVGNPQMFLSEIGTNFLYQEEKNYGKNATSFTDPQTKQTIKCPENMSVFWCWHANQ